MALRAVLAEGAEADEACAAAVREPVATRLVAPLQLLVHRPESENHIGRVAGGEAGRAHRVAKQRRELPLLPSCVRHYAFKRRRRRLSGSAEGRSGWGCVSHASASQPFFCANRSARRLDWDALALNARMKSRRRRAACL